jgi:hypothetical protein
MLSKLELEFADIKYRWRIHSELFDDDENVNLLNRCGGQVFSMLQQLMVYDTLAAICRLCDPAKSAGQENNSIYNQYEKQKSKLNDSEVQEIDALLSCLESKMKNIRFLRNKAMSHNDLGVSEKAIMLPSIKYGEVDEVIELAGNLLNKIFRVSGTYSSVTAFGLGVTKLLEVLRAGEGRANG